MFCFPATGPANLTVQLNTSACAPGLVTGYHLADLPPGQLCQSVLNPKAERAAVCCSWGDVSLANVCFSSNSVYWSSVRLHSRGNVTCTVSVSQQNSASTPMLLHAIWIDRAPTHWFHSSERMKIAKWKSGIRSCSTVRKGFARNNAQMIPKLFHTLLIFICTLGMDAVPYD